MSEGCTSCGRKGGCDHRKGEMFAAMDQALLRLYPTRRWGERDEAAAFRAGVAGLGPVLADRLARRLETLSLFCPGTPEETCDYVYVLCFGRTPSLVEVREGIAAPEAGEGQIDELYLRVALSSVAPFAAVQQVAMSLRRSEAGELVIAEAPRTGVFDPVLLPRFQKLVAVLAELEVRHLDFGEMTQSPPDFDAGEYGDRYGGAPTVANYFFYPQPASAITTTVIAGCASS
ncbi:MAG TPA: hypothetical protein VN914_19675 [Polyangia bacterium]|nr:hypothetical protein [Polyangia bacterium]